MNTQDPLTLCVFIDALGWELYREHGFLEDRLTYTRPIDTVFGYSSTCDPTILTGLEPRDHGHFAFFNYAPAGGAFPAWWCHLGHLPKSLTSRGRVRHWISRLLQPSLGWDGYFSLYNVSFERLGQLDYTEKKDLYLGDGILGGQPTLFDALRRAGVSFHLSDWRRPEASNLLALERSLIHERPRFAYLYLADLDGLLHAEGTQAPAVAEKLRGYERSIRRVLGVADAIYGDVRLLIFSDHGMCDVRHHSRLKTRVESLPLRWGRDYGSVFDATMARFWFDHPSAEAQIREVLDSEPLGRTLSDQDLRRWGCDFADRRYGELFFLLDPGALFVPSDLGQRPLAAMHGYDPAHVDSMAFFGSSHEPARPPKGLADLASVMLENTAASSLWSALHRQEVAA